jgi:hypothetical protein
MSPDWSSAEHNCVGMLPTMKIFGYKIIFLDTLDPLGCLSLQVLETEMPVQGEVVSARMEFLSIQVFVEVLHLHSSQYLP